MRAKPEPRRAHGRAFLALLAVAGCVSITRAGDDKVLLVRKYRPGLRMVYDTESHTRSTVRSDPPALKEYLPPLPDAFRTRQRTTLTVRSVAEDGSAEIEARFERFELESWFAEGIPEEARESLKMAQEDFAARLNGRSITARFDRDGRLAGLEGAEELLQGLDPTMQDTMRQVLRLSLEQMGGHAAFPDHRVAPGEEWTRRQSSEPREGIPFSVEGESTLKFVGRQRFKGIRAAALDFRFQNKLRPVLTRLRDAEAMDQLQARGMSLDIEISGRGEGQMLVAEEDGRVLKTRARSFQTLTARMDGLPGVPLPTEEPVTLEVDSETDLTVESPGRGAR
jgi:hypothetical protein